MSRSNRKTTVAKTVLIGYIGPGLAAVIQAYLVTMTGASSAGFGFGATLLYTRVVNSGCVGNSRELFTDIRGER